MLISILVIAVLFLLAAGIWIRHRRHRAEQAKPVFVRDAKGMIYAQAPDGSLHRVDKLLLGRKMSRTEQKRAKSQQKSAAKSPPQWHEQTEG